MDNPIQLFNTPPTHLSVGAVLRNELGQILCHHFDKSPGEGLSDIYVLMRETVENNESLEASVHRGLMEEFGATGTITKYLGPIIGNYPEADPTQMTEKTTLYFLVEVIDFDPARRHTGDAESASVLQWQTPEFLIEKMTAQRARVGDRGDLDESPILNRL